MEPIDAQARRAEKPTICYRIDMMPQYNSDFYSIAREGMSKISEVVIAPRDAATFEVPAGHFFRINCVDGSQVMISSV
jgi:uncharacterized protein